VAGVDGHARRDSSVCSGLLYGVPSIAVCGSRLPFVVVVEFGLIDETKAVANIETIRGTLTKSSYPNGQTDTACISDDLLKYRRAEARILVIRVEVQMVEQNVVGHSSHDDEADSFSRDLDMSSISRRIRRQKSFASAFRIKPIDSLETLAHG